MDPPIERVFFFTHHCVGARAALVAYRQKKVSWEPKAKRATTNKLLVGGADLWAGESFVPTL